jgi:hypothetical protein
MLEDQELHRRIALAARRTSVERFSDSQIVPLYESYYEEALLAPSRA